MKNTKNCNTKHKTVINDYSANKMVFPSMELVKGAYKNVSNNDSSSS